MEQISPSRPLISGVHGGSLEPVRLRGDDRSTRQITAHLPQPSLA